MASATAPHPAAASASLQRIDRQYLGHLKSALQTAQQWDADPLLLAECRALIPPHLTAPDSEYARDEDQLYSHSNSHPNLLYLKRLAVFFQTSVMTWVNQPACVNCGSNENMAMQRVRGPETLEEREGNAGRVEVYICSQCPPQNNTTTFPRYNSVRKVLETRQGRCGEYANLFGLFCRAAGLETRHVSDFTDHVWVEVYIPGDDCWVMADGCEGIIRKPSMYEDGWGKNLSGMVAASSDCVVDVTPRYTRQWNSAPFQSRRASTVVSSEAASHAMIRQVNASLRQNLTKSRVEELKHREQAEQSLLNSYKDIAFWTYEEKHGHGRISGSLQWKLARKEAGLNGGGGQGDEANKRPGMYTLSVESFYPPTVDKGSVYISVSAERGIIVSGTSCSVVDARISLVVVDEVYLGCILQSLAFESWAEVAKFVETLPNERIVALLVQRHLKENGVGTSLSRLGGFTFPKDNDTHMCYIGQVEACPDWCICSAGVENSTIATLRLPSNRPKKALSLRLERGSAPRNVATRLPEELMPLATQLLASDEQKRLAFARFVKQEYEKSPEKHCVGYTTRVNSPVYLLDQHSFPFENSGGGWSTFHFLPEELVSSDVDGGVDERGTVTKSTNDSETTPLFDVPVKSDFFAQLLGPYLLRGGSELEDTTDALSNSRLVAFYFSAHWCGPCRQFSPMLAEMYEVLKENFPSHGLEIVFISSDRDASSFSRYFGTMPWLAVPFDLGSETTIPQLKAKFGVRGIPALVVLDTVSGQIVVPMSQSRQEVTKACQGGEDQIAQMFKDWLSRVPPDSKELLEMLEMSCQEEKASQELENSYLVRDSLSSTPSPPEASAAERIKELFAKLVVEGENPNTAAAKAIQMVAEETKVAATTSKYTPGSLNGLNMEQPSDATTDDVGMAIVNLHDQNAPDGTTALRVVISTALKYVDNVRKDPSNPKFRALKLSNKVVDRITRVAGAIHLLQCLGFHVYPSEQDMMACIPAGADLDELHRQMENILIDAGG